MQFRYFAGRKLHMGVCGSVAAYKSIGLMRMMQQAGLHVAVTLTEAAQQFITPLSFEALEATRVYTKMFASDDGDCFAHLAPGQGADCFAIVPASASTLARLATGLADNMLAAQALAFQGPLVLAPAMNPLMWAHPATQANVGVLQARGAKLVLPASGRVACGVEGQGRLAAMEDVYWAILGSLAPQDLRGKHILLTLGPTREPWDGIRFWTNPSSGQMGAALAIAAWLRGARVTAIAGPGVPALPAGITVLAVEKAKEMYDAAMGVWPSADYAICTAAVADFSPLRYGEAKFKKSMAVEGFTVDFLPNPDILSSLATSAQGHQRLLGFAAETENLVEQVHAKLERKKVHMIAGNLIGQEGSGFGGTTNCMYVADATGRTEEWPVMPKTDVAWRLLDWLLTL